MEILTGNAFLFIYSGAVTAALLFIISARFSGTRKKAVFEEIEVKRINLVEPDGTLRMVISDKAMFPGAIIRGKEHPHSRGSAGMIFYNDEGTENGGLIFSGKKLENGRISAACSLTFDQYEQDQVIQVVQSEEGGERFAGLQINDRPDAALDIEAINRYKSMKEGPEKEAAARQLSDTAGGKPRVFIGKNPDRSAALVLKDTMGRKRAALNVAPDGTPSLQFFNEDGKVSASFPQA